MLALIGFLCGRMKHHWKVQCQKARIITCGEHVDVQNDCFVHIV